MSVPAPQAFARYVNENGILTQEGHLLLLAMQEAIMELETAGFQSQIDALDARVTALEP